MYLVPADDGTSLNINAQHIAGIEQREVPPNGVHPNAIGKLGISHADVTGDALGESAAGPVPKYGSHMQDDVLPVFLE